MSKQFLIMLFLMSSAKMDLLHNKFQKLPNCAEYTFQLTNLLILMCNNIAEQNDAVVRDACIGCFQQASTANNNQPVLTNLSDCAQNYLAGSRYEECTNQINQNLDGGPCVTGYCQFVTCVRRINSDLLVAQCYQEASADNDVLTEDDQIIFVKNVTSCILARTRCAPINPISGQRQSNVLTTITYNKLGKPRTNTVALYNSLQITPEGDLRIISLPGTTKIQKYFCTNQLNLRESSWLEYSC